MSLKTRAAFTVWIVLLGTMAHQNSALAASPQISSLSPTSGPAAGGTSVVITVKFFTTTTGATVLFGSTAATVTANTATTITCTTPAEPAGQVAVTVTVGAETASTTAAAGFTFTGSSGPSTAFRFLTTSLPDGSTNTFYQDTVITANGAGPVTFTATGLPPGLTINSTTGFISGRPTVVNASGFGVTITANDGTSTITELATVKVTASGGGGNGGVTFTLTAFPQGIVGTAYAVTVTVTSGVGPFILGASDLPPGLSLNGLSGDITGTPSAAGTFFVTLSVTDRGENDNKVIEVLPLVVLPADGSGFMFNNTILNNGQLGTAYTDTLTTTGGSGTVTFGATGLPAGLSIDPASGKVSGTPTVAGTFLIVYTATSGTDTISINLPLWIASSSTSTFHWVFIGLPAGIINVPYGRQPPIILATENPGPSSGVSYTAVGLPDGIVYSSSTGELSGTPTDVGIYPVTFTAVNSNASPAEVLTMTLDFIVLPPNGGDTNSLPINLWVVKQTIKKGKSKGTDGWQAQYIYNANRTKAKIFDPNKDEFKVTLGSIAPIDLLPPKDKLTGKGGKLSFKSPKGTPTFTVSLDESGETVKISAKNETSTDTLPGILPNTMVLGSKSFKLDEFFDTKGTFTPTSGLRKTAFVVSQAKLTSKAAGKDSATYALLLGDPGFVFPSVTSNGNDKTFRFQVLNGTTTVIDKTFTSLVTETTGTDKKTGAKTYKFKGGKDPSKTNALSKFSYDSGSGKMSIALKGLSLSTLLPSTSTDGVHTTVELTIGTKIYFTGLTIFAPKAGSYSTKLP